MSVLSKDEFFAALNERMKGSNSDEDIAFLENMTDTYTDMENKLSHDGEDWQKKYNDLDASWRKRYTHRFFSGNNPGNPNENDNNSEDNSEDIVINDLFEEDK